MAVNSISARPDYRRARSSSLPPIAAMACGASKPATPCGPCWSAGVARAGTEVLFLTDRRYRLHRGQAFEGAFIDAVRALFFALSRLPHPPAGEFTTGGKSLAVTHRAPRLTSSGDKP